MFADANEQIEEVEVIKLGDKEYSQSDLESLVGLGEMAKEVEQKYNTKLDRVYPEYTRSRQELKVLQDKVSQLEQGLKNQANADEGMSESTVREARDAARKLGIVTQEDFDNLMAKNFRQNYVQERQAERLLDQMDNLESEINGSDGRPKFNKREVLEYMQESGIRNPIDAYEVKYKKQTDEWRAEQIIRSKQNGFYTTEAGGGDKVPPRVEVTKENLSSLIREALG